MQTLADLFTAAIFTPAGRYQLITEDAATFYTSQFQRAGTAMTNDFSPDQGVDLFHNESFSLEIWTLL